MGPLDLLRADQAVGCPLACVIWRRARGPKGFAVLRGEPPLLPTTL